MNTYSIGIEQITPGGISGLTYTKRGYFMEMEEFEIVEFGIGDIIRSGLVRSYLIAKTNMRIKDDI